MGLDFLDLYFNYGGNNEKNNCFFWYRGAYAYS